MANSDLPRAELFLCGDVMTGRGIDQLLPRPSPPELREDYLKDARDYIRLAERRHGPIQIPVPPAYIWGEALLELDRAAPHARIINLETAVTRSEDWVDKGINYRMSPDNLRCLTLARIDICALANNHLLDFGSRGMLETLDVLEAAGLATAGAGRTSSAAQRPARLKLPSTTLAVYSVGARSSGIPEDWAATPERAGIALLPDLSERTASELLNRIERNRGPRELVIVSIHWGSNWGYLIPHAQMDFAHRLIDGGVALVHGHSSHHARSVEVYRDRLVLYGCGDFINDYEGITGFEEFRGDLAPMYFVSLEVPTGRLLDLRVLPMKSRKLRLEHAPPEDAHWLEHSLSRISADFGARFTLMQDGMLHLVP